MSWSSRAGASSRQQHVPLKRLQPTNRSHFNQQNFLNDFKPWLQNQHQHPVEPAAFRYLPTPQHSSYTPTTTSQWTPFVDSAPFQQLAQPFTNFGAPSRFPNPWLPPATTTLAPQPHYPCQAHIGAPHPLSSHVNSSVSTQLTSWKLPEWNPTSAFPQNQAPPAYRSLPAPAISYPTSYFDTVAFLPNPTDRGSVLAPESSEIADDGDLWRMALKRFLSWRPKKWKAADFCMHRVLDRLFIGDLTHAENAALLKDNGIGMVVCCVMDEERKSPYSSGSVSGIECIRVDVLDRPHENIQRFFHAVNVFIHRGRSSGRGVLVHCVKGVSRSATLVIAYLMVACGLSHQEAYAALKKVRLRVKPNSGFLRQLASIEKDLRVMGENLRMEVPYATAPDRDLQECSRLLDLISPTR